MHTQYWMQWIFPWSVSLLLGAISFMIGSIPFGYGIARLWCKELPAGSDDFTARGILCDLGWGRATVAVLSDAIKCLAGSVALFFMFLPSQACSLRIKIDEYGNAVRDLEAPYWECAWILGTALLLFVTAVAGHAWRHWRKAKVKMNPSGS